MAPFLTLIPAIFSPCACLFLSSVTVEMGFRPAFSARVNGMTSRASENWRKQYCSIPARVLEYSDRRRASSISGAPPPAIKNLFLTRHLMTQSASWIDLSASSSTSLLDPRTRTETVRPWFWMPENLTTLLAPAWTSSTRSAVPSISGWKWSKLAMGLQSRVLQTNSMSSRSTSLTTMIFVLERKWMARSLTASLRMDFWMRSTLQPAFLIRLTILRMYCLSSLSTLSIR